MTSKPRQRVFAAALYTAAGVTMLQLPSSVRRLDAFSGYAEYLMQSFSGLVMLACILELRRCSAAEMAYLSQQSDLLVQPHRACFRLHFCSRDISSPAEDFRFWGTNEEDSL